MEGGGAKGNTLVGTGIYYLFVFINFIPFCMVLAIIAVNLQATANVSYHSKLSKKHFHQV